MTSNIHGIFSYDEHIVLFDGVCNLCNRLVRFIIKRDKRTEFKFVSLQSDTGHFLLLKYGLPVDYFASVVYISKGKYYLKSSAILYILKEVGGIWRFFFILKIVPGFIRDLIYDLLAASRYNIFGRSNLRSE